MNNRRIQTIAVLAIACVVGALLFVLAPARVEAQSRSMQWVTFTVGRVSERDANAVAIYMTNGTFIVSNSPNGQSVTVHDSDGNERIETPVFGSCSENEDDSAYTWSGTLVPGTYFVGVQGDVSTLSISGEGVSYTSPAASAPVAVTAPMPVAQPAAVPVTAVQPQVNPSNGMKWFAVTVRSEEEDYETGMVYVYMTGGTFIVANTPNPAAVDFDKPEQTSPADITFGISSEDIDGVGQSWSGAQVPGTYYVGVQGDTSTLRVWGDAVSVAPMSP